jgi:ABC-type nitrate/sulfonate/bicarbonate transport system substrate-binding protein
VSAVTHGVATPEGDQMSNGSKKIRLVYRSRAVQYPLLAAMRAAGAWERSGLDVGDAIPYVKGASKSDKMLMDDEIDVIFGSHVTPYLRYDEGVPFVYLGQTVNRVEDSVATREPIDSLAELRGKRLADEVDAESHPFGNHILYLRRAGVAEDEVTWVNMDRGEIIDAIATGTADAAFLSSPDDDAALAAGLALHTPAPLPMVNATTITTLWPKVAADPDVFQRVLRAVRLGVAFYQDETEQMQKVMAEDVGPELKISSRDRLEKLYRRNTGLLGRSLYPDAAAVANAFQLAVRQRPGLEERLSPMALWDMHLLRELDAESA